MTSEVNIPGSSIEGVRLFRDEDDERKPVRSVVVDLGEHVLTLAPQKDDLGEPVIQASGRLPRDLEIIKTGSEDEVPTS